MPTAKEISQQILRILYTNANGDSADAINKYQGKTLPSFGIMYPQLKELTTKFKPSNEVAFELITKNTREARIMGILLSIPKTLTKKQLQLLTERATTEELKNLYSKHILAKVIKLYGYKKIDSLISTELKTKALIHLFRTFKHLPDFDYCIRTLEEWFQLKEKNLNDGKYFAEAIYRFYITKQKVLLENISSKSKIYPSLTKELESWKKDFHYL